MAKRINISKFQEMLMDPDVPESEIAKYLEYDEQNSQPFAPAYTINPEKIDDEGLEAAVFLAIFNQASRARRKRAYERRIRNSPNSIRLVSEGDSWFQYPILLDDVIDQLSDDYAILSLGAAGDLMGAMVGKQEYLQAIRNENPQGFLISGGGNDLLGNGKLRRFLRRFKQGRQPEDYLNARFQTFLDTVIDNYKDLFDSVTGEFPRLITFCHGYDHAVPHKGKWLGDPMNDLGIKNRKLQRDIVKVIIDRFNGKLQALTSNYNGKVRMVDCRGAVTSGQWHDELHPDDAGFASVSARFETALRAELGVVRRGDAESIVVGADTGAGAGQAGPLCPGRDHFVDDEDIAPLEYRRIIGRRARRTLDARLPKIPTEKDVSILSGMMAEKNEAVSFEKVNLESDFLPAKFLRDGARAAEAVCRIKTPVSLGSGSLIADGRFIITNNHVLPTADAATDSIAEFGFELGSADIIRVTLHPDRLFITDESLDFTIVACDSVPVSHIAPLPILRDPSTVAPETRVSIVQHPKGREKEVALHDNKVVKMQERTIRYTTDTEPGSSGSPVFNHDWEFVALHHAGVSTGGGGAENEGIKMSAIVAKLVSETHRNEAFAPQARELLNLVPDTSPFLGFFDVAGVADADGLEVEIPTFKGTPDFADVGFWNIEHFNRSVSAGRVEKVAGVFGQLSMDVMGLVEVEEPALARLRRALERRGDNMDFVVKNVRGRQDMAVLYDRETTVVTLDEDITERHRNGLSATTRSGRTAFPREPLFARCRIEDDNIDAIEFLMIVVHLKAFGDAESRARRRLASRVLADIIEDVRNREGLAVVLGGDFNEVLSNSVLDTLTDTPDLFAMTTDDDRANAATYVGGSHRSVIDHIIISNDLKPGDIAGDDAAIVRLDKSVAGFVDGVSDHVPVLFRMIGRSEPVDVTNDRSEEDDIAFELPADKSRLTLSFS